MKPESDRSRVTGASGWPTETRVILPALPRFMPASDGVSRPKRAKQPTWLHQANGYCRRSPPSICSTTPVVSSVPSGDTTVTPASASAASGSLRMLTSATGFCSWSTASWYMKHSLPSGAQRTCQSPKVSRTISITSGWAGSPAAGAPPGAAGAPGAAAPASAPGAAGAGWASPVAGASGAGWAPPVAGAAGAAGAGVSAAGASVAGAGVSWAKVGAASARPSAARVRRNRIDCMCCSRSLEICLSGDCHSTRRLSTTRRYGRPGIAPK